MTKLSGGAIAGVVIGSVVILIIVIVGMSAFVYKRFLPTLGLQDIPTSIVEYNASSWPIEDKWKVDFNEIEVGYHDLFYAHFSVKK